MADIFMLVYTSQAMQPIDDQMLRSILEASRENNHHDHITGFLVCRDNYFLQLLEGPEDKVMSCFEKIKKDDRHSKITIQGKAHSESRLMGNWAMAYVEASQGSHYAGEIIELFELGRAGGIYSSPRSLKKILELFVKNAKISLL